MIHISTNLVENIIFLVNHGNIINYKTLVEAPVIQRSEEHTSELQSLV